MCAVPRQTGEQKALESNTSVTKLGKLLIIIYSLLVMHVIDVVERLLMLSVSVLAFLQFYVMQA